jgi:hypothetical protein
MGSWHSLSGRLLLNRRRNCSVFMKGFRRQEKRGHRRLFED